MDEGTITDELLRYVQMLKEVKVSIIAISDFGHRLTLCAHQEGWFGSSKAICQNFRSLIRQYILSHFEIPPPPPPLKKKKLSKNSAPTLLHVAISELSVWYIFKSLPYLDQTNEN